MKNYIQKAKDKIIEVKNTKYLNKFFVVPEEVKDINKFYLYISTFFGCGFFKHASGTFTSAIAAILGLILIYFSHFLLLIVLLILMVIGFISSEKSISNNNNADPSYIVIDEVVGQLIPFLLISKHDFFPNLFMAFIAFVIFRLLDIYKPWIIGKSETTFKGGIAIMIDDILAGVFTLFIIFIISLFI